MRCLPKCIFLPVRTLKRKKCKYRIFKLNVYIVFYLFFFSTISSEQQLREKRKHPSSHVIQTQNYNSCMEVLEKFKEAEEDFSNNNDVLQEELFDSAIVVGNGSTNDNVSVLYLVFKNISYSYRFMKTMKTTTMTASQRATSSQRVTTS